MEKEKLNRRIKKQQQRRKESYERHLKKQQNTPQRKKNEFLSEISHHNRTGSHVGCIRVTPNVKVESPEEDRHEFIKFKVCWYLNKWGHDFITEARFLNNKRGDVIDLNEGIIYEITYSETEEELSEKIEDYPETFEVRRIDANKDLKEKDLL